MKKVSVATVSVWILMLFFTLTLSAMAQTVGVQQGQYVKYTVKMSSGGATVQGTIRVNIQSVSGTNVSGTIETSISGASMPSSFSIDVETGYGSTGMPAILIIPANLTTGDTIPGMYSTVSGVTDRSYAGASRKVVYTTGSFSGVMTVTYYWDQFTGMFVEMSGSGTVGGYSYSYEFKVTETNIWVGGMDWTTWIIIIVVIVVVVVAVVIALLLRKKKLAAAPPTQPTEPTQPPPPPPQP